MKRSALEDIQDQLTGGNSDAPNGHNLVGAINGILNTFDSADEWGATPGDDDWTDAHEDFQHLARKLVNDLNDVLGTDDTLDDDDGTKLADLPHAATAKDQTGDLPSPPNGG